MAHVSEQKKKIVKEFTELIDKYQVIGAIDMSNLPTRQLQVMRKKLRDKNAVLKMSKKRLLKIAFSNSKKKNISELEPYLKGMPALVFTEENPFRLYSELQKTKSKAPAKAGQEAPRDITVKAGQTSFTPGPVISQLAKFGIKTGIEGGKIAIKSDTVVVKKGQKIDGELASILTRLGIEPMEIGLNLKAVYQDGQVFEADVLEVDTDAYTSKFASAYAESISLALETGYTTTETIKILISKAHNDARNLALSQNIFSDETTADIIRKAYLEAKSISTIGG